MQSRFMDVLLVLLLTHGELSILLCMFLLVLLSQLLTLRLGLCTQGFLFPAMCPGCFQTTCHGLVLSLEVLPLHSPFVCVRRGQLFALGLRRFAHNLDIPAVSCSLMNPSFIFQMLQSDFLVMLCSLPESLLCFSLPHGLNFGREPRSVGRAPLFKVCARSRVSHNPIDKLLILDAAVAILVGAMQDLVEIVILDPFTTPREDCFQSHFQLVSVKRSIRI
mmetsp:Transcript_3768/g.6213  ORF Transcript_3768/g.6213 Transcript_3768/m.6213 type:complete len:220 (-) Transcript_3768:310-969(-)